MFNIILNHFLLFKTHVSNTMKMLGALGIAVIDYDFEDDWDVGKTLFLHTSINIYRQNINKVFSIFSTSNLIN